MNATDFLHRDSALLRLQAHAGRIQKDHSQSVKRGGDLRLLRIDGLSRCWEPECEWQLHRRIETALSGHCSESSVFLFMIVGDGRQTSFFLGASDETDERALKSVFSGVLQDVSFSSSPLNLDMLIDNVCGRRVTDAQSGVIRGMPAIPAEGETYFNPAYMLAKGMQGQRYCVMYVCCAVPQDTINTELSRLFDEKTTVGTYEQITINVDDIDGNSSHVTNNYACKQYLADLARYEQHLTASRSIGAWEITGYYLADTPATAARLTSLLRAVHNGETAGPEPVVCFGVKDVYSQIKEASLAECKERAAHPLDYAKTTAFSNPLRTQLSSRQLASLLMLPDKEIAGFYVNEPSAFDLTSRKAPEAPAIRLGDVLTSMYDGRPVGDYQFSVRDFSRHALVAGATGGGKSNTIRSMLLTLYAGLRVPFMVIESAKSEYWQLHGYKGFEQLGVMSLGAMDCPFRLNPFECTAGFPLQTHVDSLLSTFNAAFEMYTPMPFILEQAVYEVYADYGWDIATGVCRRPQRLYPSLSDLYWQIPETVSRTAYDKEIKDNVTGALQTRVHSLMVGGKGLMMNSRSSTPLDALLKLPTVLELENLGDDATKAFVMGLLMNCLYEYRRVESSGYSRDFSHLLIIEEAHRLLKNVPPTQEGSRSASVEFFCNMLAEIRSYGQGIMIADQSPMKLAQDSLRNTNLKIVHRMVDREDRMAICGAMHMNEEQQEAVTMLPRGVAAVYAEGDNRPKLVYFPLVETTRAANRDAALRKARELLRSKETAVTARHAGCRYCPYAAAGRCSQRERARNNEAIAEYGFQRYPEEQRKDYEQRYSKFGPAALQTDAIVRYAMQKTLRVQGVAEDQLDARYAVVPAADRLCVAGFTLATLHLGDALTPELIVDRYSNLLYEQDLL